VHASGRIVVRLSFRYQHRGETYLLNREGARPLLSVRRGETYLPNAAKLRLFRQFDEARLLGKK
jgi:hypothetical protein